MSKLTPDMVTANCINKPRYGKATYLGEETSRDTVFMATKLGNLPENTGDHGDKSKPTRNEQESIQGKLTRRELS